MAKLTDYAVANVIKMLLVGDNGAGKTGVAFDRQRWVEETAPL